MSENIETKEVKEIKTAEENVSAVKVIGNALSAGGAAAAIVVGWLSVIFQLLMTQHFPVAYYYWSYVITIACLGLFLIGQILSIGYMPQQNKKPTVHTIIAAALFIIAMLLMFSKLDFSSGASQGLKDAYMIYAIRAALIFVGIFFFQKAVKKTEFKCKKVWKVIVRVTLYIMLFASLLLFIPVLGDLYCGFIFLLVGIVQLVCLYPMVYSNNK
jgi:hypothetical protein